MRSIKKSKRPAKKNKKVSRKASAKLGISKIAQTTLTSEMGVIRFYRANEKPYGAFSNLFKRPIEFEGQIYPTSEHAYQAGKAIKAEVRDWILSAPSPSLAAMAAHGLYSWDIVPDWAKIKYDRMRKVLLAKFSQHEDLARLLVSTGSARLVEAGRVDNAVNRLWGEVNGRGDNMLGVMLMELRDHLLKSRDHASPTKKRSKKVNQAVLEQPTKSKRKAKAK